MQTVFEHIRSRLLTQAGVESGIKPQLAPTYEELVVTEWNSQFELLMRNRLIMGAIRYGTLKQKAKKEYDYLKGLKEKIRLYAETGNTEFMVDAANYCLLEFTIGKHPLKHWHALDEHYHHCPLKEKK